MIYQELPGIDATPLDGASRWLVPVLVGGAALSAALLVWLLGYFTPALVIAAGGILVAAVLVLLALRREPAVAEPLSPSPDYAIIGSALGLCRDPAALTN